MSLLTKHIPELQTLRGLAAVVVALSHITNVYVLPRAWRIGFDTALNSHAAVILFFVLSGYVLSASLLRTGENSLGVFNYYLRRLFRIYPAVWVVSAVSLLIISTVGANTVAPTASDWFINFMLPSQMSPRTVLRSLYALDTYLIPPVWTIFLELVGSLFLPVFVWIARTRSRLVLPLLVVLAVLVFLFNDAPRHLYVLSYLFYFALGMGVFILPGSMRQNVAIYALPIVIVSVAVLVFFRAVWFMALTGELQPIVFQFGAPLPAFVEGLSSAALVAAIVNLCGRFRWLQTGALGVLGDISYSFYLLHFPIMSALARTLSPLLKTISASGLTAAMVLIALTLLLTILSSILLYRLIERPGIAAGKRFVLILSHRTEMIV